MLAAALLLPSAGALAAGLGKLTVLSALGQPLRAELDISASREELSSMSARLASDQAFKQVGIEYAPGLAGIRFTVDKRPDGRPFVRLSTERPVNDPFLDFLVELTWASGRMVREYTVLLDPPLEVQKPAPAVVAVPEAPPPAAVAAPPRAPEPTVAAPAEPMPRAVAAAPAAEAATRTVERGDTLAKIARETKPEGVSLDQMLVALFRSNQAAFDGANMNRLRTGRILTIPEAGAVEGIAGAEASKVVVSHAADFNAYRQKLAATVAATPAAKEAAPQQLAAGKITPQVEDKVPAPAPGQDKLQVSRTETARTAADKAAQTRIAALEEDLVARDRALKEAGSRIADLERNISDLKKLAELKSQAGAQMQKQAEAAKPAAPAAKKPDVPAPVAAVVEPPKPAEPPKAAEVPPPVAAVEKPAEKPAEAAKPVEPPKPAPKKAVEPPPPPPEPDFMEENAALVYGGGGVLALLLGYLGFSAWRRKQQATGGPTTSRVSEGDLTANSVFGTTGGQAVDTGASIQTDFSQSSLGAIDADEGVDPVAEADVYMAYGRDAQAEEILIDAIKNDPTRHAIHLKLLEIYAGRKSLKQFEALASDLQGQTGGAGADWEKASALGRSVDPENPLYGAPGEAGEEQIVTPLPDLAATTVIIPPSEVEKLKDTVTLPGQLAQMATEAEVPAMQAPPVLDFDLDLGAPAESAAEPAAPEMPVLDFDLDLGAPAAQPEPLRPDEMTHLNLDGGVSLEAMPPADEPTHINVDFALGEPGGAPAAAEPATLDFEFDLGLGSAEAAPVASAEPAAMDVDFSATDLRMSEGAEPTPAAEPGAAEEGDNPDVATKLELAQAYEEMGDREGARELLQEVLQEGSGRQQEAARSKLATLDA